MKSLTSLVSGVNRMRAEQSSVSSSEPARKHTGRAAIQTPSRRKPRFSVRTNSVSGSEEEGLRPPFGRGGRTATLDATMLTSGGASRAPLQKSAEQGRAEHGSRFESWARRGLSATIPLI